MSRPNPMPAYDAWMDVYTHRLVDRKDPERLHAVNYEICFLNSPEGCIVRKKSTKRPVKFFCGARGASDPTITLSIDQTPIKFMVSHVMLMSADRNKDLADGQNTVDHIDNDYKNMNIANLQWMTLNDNAGKFGPFRERKPIIIQIPLDAEEWRPWTLDEGKTTCHVSNYGRFKTSTGLISLGTPGRGTKYRACNVRCADLDGKRRDKKTYVHILVWRAFRGEIQDGMQVMHNDAAPCNEDGTYRNWLQDLSIGTRTENMVAFHAQRACPATTLASPGASTSANPNPNATLHTVVVESRPRFAENDNIKLPIGCWMQKETPIKGSIVVVEIKRAIKNGKTLFWKSPSEKTMRTLLKREIAKKFVRWVLQRHPDVAPMVDVRDYAENLKDMTPDEVTLLNQCIFEPETHDPFEEKAPGRRKNAPIHTVSKLPDGCGVLPKDIPKYAYYRPASEKRGDKFIIDRHPNMMAMMEKNTWSTTEARAVTTRMKFENMMAMMAILDAGKD